MAVEMQAEAARSLSGRSSIYLDLFWMDDCIAKEIRDDVFIPWMLNQLAVSSDNTTLFIAHRAAIINVTMANHGRIGDNPTIKWMQFDSEITNLVRQSSSIQGDVFLAATMDGHVYGFMRSDEQAEFMLTLRLPNAVTDTIDRSVWGVTYLQNYPMVVTSSNTHLIALSDVMYPQRCYILEGHAHNIPSVNVSGDGRFLASASIDGTARVWDLSTRQLLYIANKDFDAPVWAISFFPIQYVAASYLDMHNEQGIDNGDLSNCNDNLKSLNLIVFANEIHLFLASFDLSILDSYDFRSLPCRQYHFGHPCRGILLRTLPALSLVLVACSAARRVSLFRIVYDPETESNSPYHLKLLGPLSLFIDAQIIGMDICSGHQDFNLPESLWFWRLIQLHSDGMLTCFNIRRSAGARELDITPMII